MHNGLIREYPRVKCELQLRVVDDLYASIEGTTDSETMFYLALTFGLEDDPVAAVGRMVGLVEEAGRKHGIEQPIQMTVATTNGESIWAFRYSSEHDDSRSLFFSTRIDALREMHPELVELGALSDETRVVVSEPLGDVSAPGTRSRSRTSGSSSRARTRSSRSLPRRRGPPPARVRMPHPRQAQSRAVEIGEPQRTYTVEPIEDPVPRESPAPDEEPAEPQREPEEVPGR